MGWFSRKQAPATEEIEVVVGEDRDETLVDNDASEVKQDVSGSELEKLRKDAEEARTEANRYKQEAERARTERTEAVDKLNIETDSRYSAEEVAIANALTAFSMDADRIQRDLVAAQENGKYEEAAKLQRDLSSAQFKIDEWTNKKASLETEKKHQPRVTVTPTQDELIGRELEKYNQHPLVKEWLGNNRKYFTDARFRTKVDAAHYDAEAEGHAFGTKEYRDYVESAVNKAAPKQEEIKQEPKTETTRQQSRGASALPPSRSTSHMSNPNKETIKLSAQEVEFAQIANPQLYAKDPARALSLYAASQKALLEEGKIRKWN